ncbi:hypothetical protein CHS0354_029494 [Potamilus streckersoni]|uniref:F5/8 type C domain-containing protein n=1 Tax=Potamilus streckersoni TaxID=2493646 RepID=A0AAE0S890_9BIVA|nr:hypothetical protein CHS0354_029494 [Potamilus streckersoni]
MDLKYSWIRLLVLEILMSIKQVVSEDFPNQAVADQRVCNEYLVSGPKYRVSDEQLNASSQISDLHAAKWGRLNMVYVKDEHIGGWAANNGTKLNHYIEVRLNERSNVKAIATQGRNITGDTQTNPQYVKKYQVYYKIEPEMKWESVKSFGNTTQEFQGNNDSNSILINKLPNTVEATFVRILLLKWQNLPSMRFDVIGCPVSQGGEKDTKTSEIMVGVGIFVGVLGLSVVTTIVIFFVRRRRSRSSSAATSNQSDQKMEVSVVYETVSKGKEVFIDTRQEYANVIYGKSTSDPADRTDGINQGDQSTHEIKVLYYGYEYAVSSEPKIISEQETQEDVTYDHLDSGERVPIIDITYDHVKKIKL